MRGETAANHEHRNYVKDRDGDHIKAALAAAGDNFSLLLCCAALSSFCLP
jgi:hypothetical protein